MMIVIVTKMTKTVTTMRVTMSVDQIVQEWPSMPAFITWLQSILFRSVEQSTSSSSTLSSSSATTLTGMIHLTFDQVLYEPIFWALSRWVICFWIQVCFCPLFAFLSTKIVFGLVAPICERDIMQWHPSVGKLLYGQYYGHLSKMGAAAIWKTWSKVRWII